MPSPETVRKALALIRRNAVNRAYFFSKVESPDWIEPLSGAGFFADPPSSGDGTSLPAWGEVKYLVRMAAIAPRRVASVAHNVPLNDNLSVHADLARVAAQLRADDAAKWAARETKWLSEQPFTEWPTVYHDPLVEALGDLVEHLVAVGRAQSAMLLARSLMEIRIVAGAANPTRVRGSSPAYQGDSPRTGGTVSRTTSSAEDRVVDEYLALAAEALSARCAARLSSHDYREFSGRCLPILLDAGGLGVLQMLCGLVQESTDSGDMAAYEHVLSRPAIEPHGQNYGSEVSDALIDAIRDASIHVVDSGETVRRVVEAMGWGRASIFKRLILHLVAERCDSDLPLAAELALCRDTFDDVSLLHEYSRLLTTMFPKLDARQQALVLGWIDGGPRFDEWMSVDDEKRRMQRLSWQAVRLAWVREDLDPKWRRRYASIVKEVGEPEHPEFSSYTTVWMGPTSPVDADELQKWPPAKVAEYLGSWTPSGDPMLPDRDGLGRVLEGVVANAPEGFLVEASAFLQLPVGYVEEFLRGLRRAAEEGRALDWAAAVGMLWRIVECHHSDVDWNLARREGIRLMSAGLQSGGMDYGLRKQVWSVISTLCDDDEPYSADDESEGTIDVATRSINGVRGQALHAVVLYALWVREHMMSSWRKDPVDFNMEAITEVRIRLDRHLDSEVEASPAVRAVYGQWFPHLCLLDEEWAGTNIDRIFPDGFPKLRDAAWTTYLRFNPVYSTPFALLRGRYAAAVHRLAETEANAPVPRDSPSAHLGHHLLVAAGNGALSWSDGDALVRQYVRNAEPDDARTAVVWVGRELRNENNQFPLATIDRLAQLVDDLLDLLEEHGRDRLGHLSSLGSWIASGRFNAAWVLPRLRRLVELAGTADPEIEVTDHLVDLAKGHPAETFGVLKAWVGREDRGRDLPRRRSANVRRILRAAIAEESVNDEAEDLIHRLGAEGHLRYRDLLPR